MIKKTTQNAIQWNLCIVFTLVTYKSGCYTEVTLLYNQVSINKLETELGAADHLTNNTGSTVLVKLITKILFVTRCRQDILIGIATTKIAEGILSLSFIQISRNSRKCVANDFHLSLLPPDL